MRSFVSILLILTCAVASFAGGKPSWYNGYHKDLRYSTIRVVTGFGKTADQARMAAVQRVLGDQAIATGQRVNVSIQPNGTIVSTGSDALTVKARILDGGEYIEQLSDGDYRAKLLMQVAKNPTYTFEPVDVTQDYGFTPAVFVPGMAQIKKGSPAKGILFITAEIASVGTIIVAESLRSSSLSKISTTQDIELRKKYGNDVNNYSNMRNMAIGAAAAFYLWSMIDGIVAKGKPHVVVKNIQYSVGPFASPDAVGVSLCLNF